jgi:hypothetical protein
VAHGWPCAEYVRSSLAHSPRPSNDRARGPEFWIATWRWPQVSFSMKGYLPPLLYACVGSSDATVASCRVLLKRGGGGCKVSKARVAECLAISLSHY